MSDQPTLAELEPVKWFFGGNGRGPAFVKHFLNYTRGGSSYSQKILEVGRDPVALGILQVGSRSSMPAFSGLSQSDLNNEVFDFLVLTGAAHAIGLEGGDQRSDAAKVKERSSFGGNELMIDPTGLVVAGTPSFHKNISDNVIQKWGSLPKPAKDFYNQYMNIVPTAESGKRLVVDTNKQSFDSWAGKNMFTDAKGMQLNLKKQNVGARAGGYTGANITIDKVNIAPKHQLSWALDLPQFTDELANKINQFSLSSIEDPGIVAADTKVFNTATGGANSKNILLWAYMIGYYMDLANIPVFNESTGGKKLTDHVKASAFSNWEELISHLAVKHPWSSTLFGTASVAEALYNSLKPVKGAVPKVSDIVDIVTCGQWKRDSDNKLVFINSDGKVMKYGQGTDEERKMLNANCASLYFADPSQSAAQNATDCAAFTSTILQQKDSSDLVHGSINKSNYYEHFKKNITKNVHPYMALKVLKRFGFRQASVYDSVAGVSKVEVESADDWKSRLISEDKKHRGIDMVDWKAMLANNDHLLHFLDYMSQHVNCNPDILNPAYTGPSGAQSGITSAPALAQKLGLKRALPPRHSPVIGFQLAKNNLRNRNYSNSLVTGMNPFLGAPNFFRPAGLSMHGGMGMKQSGGGNIKAHAGGVNQVGVVYAEQLLNKVLTDLRNNGKELHTQNKKEIDALITKMKRTQQQILKVLLIIDQYNDTIQSLGPAHQVRESGVSVQHLKDFVRKHGHLRRSMNRLDDRFMDVLIKISKQSSPDSSSFYTNTDNAGALPEII